MKKRARFSKEQRSQLLEAFKESGLSVSEFARRNGLGRTLLSVWLMRHVRQPVSISVPTNPPSEVVLQEVGLSQFMGQRSWAAEVTLPGGLTVRLDARGQAQLLSHLIRRIPVC